MNVLVIGSSVIDLFLEIEDKHKINVSGNKVSFTLGDKIAVDTKTVTLGGNGANVAVGLKRLSSDVEFATYLGTDIFSKQIEKALEKEDITLLLQKTDTHNSSFSLIFDIQNDRIIFSHHEKRHHAFQYTQENTPNFAYLTSIGNEWEKAYRDLLLFVKEKNIPLSFTPGTPQLEKKTDIVLDTIAYSHIILINKEEAETLTKWIDPGHADHDIKTLLLKVKKFGPDIVSITDGAQGAYALDEHNVYYFIRPLEGKTLEKTGAGDAYTSGFLAKKFLGGAVPECMRWGGINAHYSMQKIGAQDGLLTREEIERIVNDHQEFHAEKL